MFQPDKYIDGISEESKKITYKKYKNNKLKCVNYSCVMLFPCCLYQYEQVNPT